MHRHRALRAAASFILLVAFTVLASGGASAAPDGQGREWRSLTQTLGLSVAQVAEICPRDGVTPCSGSIGTRDLTGWVWATDRQVVELLAEFEPTLLTADPPWLSGADYFTVAMGFFERIMGPTFSVSGYAFSSTSASGWTSSVDANGTPIEGRVGYGWWPPTGTFGVRPSTTSDHYRGIWLWRAAGDYSPPVITPTVAGTAGSNGWYVSDVSVSWDVVDAESPIDSMTGCDQSSVTSDTSDTTFTCEATSAGGAAQASATVKRDVTPPTVTCETPTPVLQVGALGASVSASVTDDTSGPVSATASTAVSTSAPGSFSVAVTGFDRAGNRTTENCSYEVEVVIPPCYDLAPTIVGTVGNDVINGTSGRDVIVSLGGNDTIYGRDGNDVVCGGAGADRIEGGNGLDTLAGEDGSDTIYGGASKDTGDGGAGDDSLYGSGGDDTLHGGADYDSIRGESGSDTCSSGEIRMSSCEVKLP